MATKAQKIASELNDEFRNDLRDAMFEKFSIDVVTEFGLFSGLQTRRVDGEEFTVEQKEFADAFEKGFICAMVRVRKYAG